MRFFRQKSSRKSNRGFLRAQEGITTVEFAVIVPTMLIMMMAVIEFSLIMFTMVAMESATSTTARLGKTGYTATGGTRASQIVQNVMNETAGLLDPAKITIVANAYTDLNQIPATDPTGQTQNFGNSGDIVVYTVTYPWPIMTPGLSAIMGATYTIKTRTVVKNEPF